jgi:hypothetical protein
MKLTIQGTIALLTIGSVVACHPIPQNPPELRPGQGIQGYQQGPCNGLGERMATGYGESAPPTANLTRSVVWRGERRDCFTTAQTIAADVRTRSESIKR